MLVYTLMLLPLTLMPAFFGALGAFYGVAAALLGARLLWYCVRLLRERSVDTGGLADVPLLPALPRLLFVAMGIDRALPSATGPAAEVSSSWISPSAELRHSRRRRLAH